MYYTVYCAELNTQFGCLQTQEEAERLMRLLRSTRLYESLEIRQVN